MNEYEEPPVTVGSDTPRALSSDCRGEFELMSPSFTSCKVHFRTSYTVRVIGRVIRRLRVRQSRGAESQRIHVHARAILQKLVAAMSYNRITRQPPVSAFTPAPPPPTELGVYRTLFSRAGVHVSPLCLDAMSIGDKWNNFICSMDLTTNTKHQKNSLGNERKRWGARSDIHCYQGVYVSPLCLDAMSIGGKWNNFIGSMDVTLRTTKMKHQKDSLENERKKWAARLDIHCPQVHDIP
ncbi:putative aryl-alcohol dehydrogenase [Moniliophthora roreri]|nr:putative aryl-alcohol dehydrogenase [Moniliophthora roreri]